MKSEICLLFKLKSGEEVIAHVIKKTKLKYTVKDPYIFKMSTVVHPVTAQAHEIMTIHDWMKLTETKITDIPTDHIVSSVVPSAETQNIYTQELKNKDKKKPLSYPKNPKKDHKQSSIELRKPEQISDEEMQKILKEMFGTMFEVPGTVGAAYPIETTPEEFNKNPMDLYNELFPPKDKTKSKSIPMIQMSLLFPPEVMIDLMESGLINVNDVNKIAKEVKRKLKWTGDERHREDFGNKSTDWNSNPSSDDYN
jgi:hypothetical protein